MNPFVQGDIPSSRQSHNLKPTKWHNHILDPLHTHSQTSSGWFGFQPKAHWNWEEVSSLKTPIQGRAIVFNPNQQSHLQNWKIRMLGSIYWISISGSRDEESTFYIVSWLLLFFRQCREACGILFPNWRDREMEDRTLASCSGNESVNHWNAREVPVSLWF